MIFFFIKIGNDKIIHDTSDGYRRKRDKAHVMSFFIKIGNDKIIHDISDVYRRER